MVRGIQQEEVMIEAGVPEEPQDSGKPEARRRWQPHRVAFSWLLRTQQEKALAGRITAGEKMMGLWRL